MYFQKGSESPLTYPLITIPHSDGASRLVNPKIGKAHNIPAPTMPGDPAFEAELTEVFVTHAMVQRGHYPGDFLKKHHPREDFNPYFVPAPLAAEGLRIDDPQGMANVVHMDSPIDLHLAILRWLIEDGAMLKERYRTSEHIDFLGLVPYVIENVADAVKRNLIKAFEVKYFYGRPRPEEVLGQRFDLTGEQSAMLFTAYPEGCPNHCSYIAGHSAAAAAGTVFKKMFNLTPEQWNVVYDCCYLWGQYRTFAGVHYATDNLQGLLLGGLRP